MLRSLQRAGVTRKKRFRPSEQFRHDVEKKRAAFLEEVKDIAPDRLIFIESGCNIAMSPPHAPAPKFVVWLKGPGPPPFLPPYSHELSPIEPCWSFLKRLRTLKERVPAPIKAAIVRGLHRLTSRHLTSWFVHCGYHFK
jgi:hypothetical protein